MTSIPFTVYDVFAYLSSGLLLMAASDYSYGSKLILREEIPVPLIILFLFISYVLGHIVASLSEPILQDLVVRRGLGVPSQILMGLKPSPIMRRLFPRYLRPMPAETQRRVLDQAASRGFKGSGESLFLHAFAVVCQSEAERKRLDEFRNLYGFSRNVSFSLLLATLILGSTRVFAPNSLDCLLPIAALTAAIAMFSRFLKFYRQYTYQLLITYAELPLNDKSKAKPKEKR
jgi:hypothetical protein